MEAQKDNAWYFLFVAWVMALVSTMGSLFFSEVMKYPPCVLCWYQRICMYPLVPLLLVGLFPFDRRVFKFSMPILLIGWVIAFYHNLLYYKILPESAAPCVQGISCTTAHIEWLGFITIPLLSLTAFSLIIFLLILTFRKSSHEKP
ncbi:MAG TPA: disulfide oxidoreductase [Bacteriovoracaceae bacterium]|nr:disulfide oxidoreductase [Bacteriovoracaceae bacterium]